jgi:Tfp pilus assembly protein PilV
LYSCHSDFRECHGRVCFADRNRLNDDRRRHYSNSWVAGRIVCDKHAANKSTLGGLGPAVGLAYTHTFARRVCDSDADGHADGHADGYTDTYVESKPDANADRNTDSNSHANAGGFAKPDSHADSESDTDAIACLQFESASWKSAGLQLQCSVGRWKKWKMCSMRFGEMKLKIYRMIATKAQCPRLGSKIAVGPDPCPQSGFSLIEICIALVVLMVAMLGVAQAFTYAITYNMGNATRNQALVILQQRAEGIRAAKWTASGIDTLITGGVKADQTVTAPNGGQFKVSLTVDDDPYTDGTQVDAASQLKEITLSVQLVAPSPGWQMAVPATLIMRRSRGN